MSVTLTAAGLVEREGPLALVREAWAAASPGFGSAWLICSEAGGGKTAFLRECVRDISPDRRFWGEAEPISPPEPYLAISRAFPTLDLSGPQAGTAARAVELLSATSVGGPVAVCFDDLQFADEGTLSVARRIAVEARSRGWLVLLSFRPREGLAALQAMAAELVEQGRGTRLDLPALGADGVAEVVARIRGGAQPASESARIAAESGGNPWFVEVLARGDAALSAARNRVQVRLARIERELPGAFSVLSSLSAVTSPIPYDIAASLCGGDSPELRELLRGLLDALILEERDDRWHFRQEMMRRAVLESMIPADRRDAHLRLAEALETTGRPAELASHFAAANDPRAGRWALRAAEDAIRMDAHAQAFAQLQRALAGGLEPSEKLDALALACTQASLLGRLDEALSFAQRGLAEPAVHPRGAIRLATAGAIALHWRGHVEEAVPYWSRGADASDREPASPDAALFHAWRAFFQVASDDARGADLAAALARKSIAAAEPSPELNGADAMTEFALATARLLRGDHNAAAAGSAALVRLRAMGLVVWTMALATFAAAALHALHQEAADGAVESLADTVHRRRFGPRGPVDIFRALGRIQGGDYGPIDIPEDAERALPAGTAALARLRAARGLREIRGGSLSRAGQVLEPQAGDTATGLGRMLVEMVRVEYAAAAGLPEAAALADALLRRALDVQHARAAGEAAVHLARSGVASERPAWLPAGSPLEAYWDWAAALTDIDEDALRRVSSRFESLGCPHEAASALADAGELAEAYRRLRAIEATTLREQVSTRLRRAGIPIPRRTRSLIAGDGLTDMEREVARMVAGGARNRAVAEELGISVRTVETHLVNIYRKTGITDRTSLALWWQAQEP